LKHARKRGVVISNASTLRQQDEAESAGGGIPPRMHVAGVLKTRRWRT
jgi:hypothetical protein